MSSDIPNWEEKLIQLTPHYLSLQKEAFSLVQEVKTNLQIPLERK